MNVITLSGRFTKDPALRAVGEHQKTRFRIAVQRDYPNRDGEYEADFVSCEAWGKTAEFICKHFTVGKPIEVTGQLATSHWEDEDGKHNDTFVRVSKVCFVLTSKAEGKENPAGAAAKTPDGNIDDAFPDFPEDDLPF